MEAEGPPKARPSRWSRTAEAEAAAEERRRRRRRGRDAALAAPARHLARPARRRSRQPGPRVRTQPAQRRLARRRRARAAARRPWRSKFNGRLAEIRIDGHKVALLKPETFMNDSGRAVQAAARSSSSSPTRCWSSTTRATWRPGGCSCGAAAAWPGTTACARSPAARRPRLPAPARRGRGGRSAATPASSPTGCSPTSSRTRTRTRSSTARPTRSRRSTRDGLEAAQRRVN